MLGAPMNLMHSLCLCLCAACTAFTATSCFAPRAGSEFTPEIIEKREVLQNELEDFLPDEEKTQAEARAEAAWLAYTAYAASGAIARLDDPVLPGWFNNMLVNAGMQDRGLCWHYQHDLYRELRRKPLHYFRVGCCVRDRNKRPEHNCVYVTARNLAWPDCIILDPWIWNGHLKLLPPEDIDEDWEDLPEMTNRLAEVYPENHRMPLAHWFMIKAKDGKYHPYYTPEARASAQYRRMVQNIHKERASQGTARAETR